MPELRVRRDELAVCELVDGERSRRRTMRIERVTGGAELVRLYQALLAGEADPAADYVVNLDSS